jgi:cyanosortase A-associated protein
MIIWKQLRTPLLVLTFASIFLVLGKVIILPTQDKRTVTPFVFPQEVPLPQWQFVSSHPLPSGGTEKQGSRGEEMTSVVSHQKENKKIQPDSELISQKHYQYTQNNLPLNIEMRYLTQYDVSDLIKKYTSISSKAVVHHKEGMGYYGLGVDRQQAYLSACINSKGNTTFTGEQFNRNQYISDINPQQLLSWLLGQNGTKDKRCLWTHLSVPLKNSSPEAAYQTLETAWFSWYQWWRSRFPQ